MAYVDLFTTFDAVRSALELAVAGVAVREAFKKND
jgi:hypothetical protein